MVKLENVSKYYHSSSMVTQALREINLEFKLGDFVAIVGESGSGKTTLLNIIGGIDTYEDGDIYIDGQSTMMMPPEKLEKFRSKNISFIFQNNNLIDSYSVLQNVEAALVLQGLKRKDRKRQARKIIEQVGLTSRIKHRATKLSGGERQRLAIARALAQDTKIIIADEPTGSLDSKTGAEIITLLREVSKNKLILLVTHNFPQVEKYCTRKIRIYNGEIVEDTRLKEISKIEKKETEKEVETRGINKAFTLFLYNFFSDARRSLFVFLLSFILVFSVFTIYSYSFFASDPYVSDENYLNSFPERLIVKRQNELPLTETDYNYINKDYRVDKIIKADSVLDMQFNAFFSLNQVGRINFHGYFDHQLNEQNKDEFWGRLPETKNEILIALFVPPRNYEQYLTLIGEELNFVINDQNVSINSNFKIVGIVPLEEDQNRFYIVNEAWDEIYSKIKAAHIIFEFELKGMVLRRNILKSSIVEDERLEGYDIESDYLYNNYLEFKDTIIRVGKNVLNLSPKNVGDGQGYYNIYVSSKLYEEIESAELDIEYQYTIILKNKMDRNKLTKKLLRNGYDVYSPFYDNALGLSEQDAVNHYLLNIGIHLGVYLIIIIVYLFSYFIYKIVLRGRSKDYLILNVLGGNNKLIRGTIYLEFLFSFLLAYIMFFIGYTLMGSRFPILKHYRFHDYLIIIIINSVLTFVVVNFYFKSIKKKSIYTSLRDWG